MTTENRRGRTSRSEGDPRLTKVTANLLTEQRLYLEGLPQPVTDSLIEAVTTSARIKDLLTSGGRVIFETADGKPVPYESDFDFWTRKRKERLQKETTESPQE